VPKTRLRPIKRAFAARPLRDLKADWTPARLSLRSTDPTTRRAGVLGVLGLEQRPQTGPRGQGDGTAFFQPI
jgi:hypothetical protein